MSADFGRPQGVLTSVLAVVALVVGAAGLFFGLSTSKMKGELIDRIVSAEEAVATASQQVQTVSAQVRQLDVQTQRALITIGTKIQMMDTKLNPPTNTTSSTVSATRPTMSAGAASATQGAAGTHAVKSGETLGKIAQKYGTTSEALLKLNPGLDPRRMKIGTTVKVPAAAAPR